MPGVDISKYLHIYLTTYPHYQLHHCLEEAANRVPGQDPRCGGGTSQEEEEAETAAAAAELEDSDTGAAHRLEIPSV